MTSYDFEKAAKNAVIDVLGEDIVIDQLEIIWFAHLLGCEKCTICGRRWAISMLKLLITVIKMRCMLIFMRRSVIRRFHQVNLIL